MRGTASKRIGHVVSVGMLAWGAASGALAQEEPTFGSGVELITIDAVVVDEDGQPVTGLTPGDFVVLDGGEPQAITSFQELRVPPAALEPPADEGAPVELMASTNQQPQSAFTRSFLIVYDAIHIGPTRAQKAKEAVSRFIREEIRPGDRVAAVATGSGSWWTAEIPGGREDLVAFIEAQPSGLAALNPHLDGMTAFEAQRIAEERDRQTHLRVLERWLGDGRCEDRCVESQFDRMARGSGGAGGRPGIECGAPCDVMACNRHCADRIMGDAQMAQHQERGKIGVTLETLERAMGELATVRGRKSIVLVSEGFTAEPGDPRYERVIQASLQANSAIYFLDAQGLQAHLGANDISRWGVPFDEMAVAGEQMAFATMGARELAVGSGGFVIRSTNDLAAGMARVSRESEACYLIGYPPPVHPGKAGFRRIEVHVDRPGVDVRARKGYFVDEAGAVVQAVVPEEESGDSKSRRALPPASTPRSDLPLRMTALVGPPAEDGRVRVRLITETSLLSLRGAAQHGDELELLADVWPRAGEEWVSFDQRVKVPRKEISSGESPPWMPVTHDVALHPGVYQARVRLRDPGTGRVGTVTHRFEVPEPTGLRVCTPVVTDSLERDSRGRPRLLPTAQRSFGISRTPHLFVQFTVEGARGGDHVTARAALQDRTGRVVRAVPWERVPASGDRLTRMLGIGLDGLSPGPYELRIDARAEATGEAYAHRERIVLTP